MAQTSSGSHGQSVERWTIDLSMKPRDRYVALAAAYKVQIQHLTSLFDQLLADLGIPYALHRTINSAARLTLRKLHSSTETEEIRGIADTAGVPVYLLVAFNVLLDLLMGCTSGGVRSQYQSDGEDSRMLHFRTLDWGMDPLRSVIVQLDFVESKSSSPDKILGSSITYVGFVGVLTGVREGLSVSLNFRAIHNAKSLRERINFRFHHLLVLLGLRQSISSLLRDYLLGDSKSRGAPPASLAWLRDHVPAQHSTAAYLIFSDGDLTVTIEKDYDTGVVRESKSFIALTNHDLEDESDGAENKLHNTSEPTKHAIMLAAMADFLDESTDRRDCIVKKWRSKVRKEYQRRQQEALESASPPAKHWISTRSRKITSERETGDQVKKSSHLTVEEDTVALRLDELIAWVSDWPTTNECTHYAVVLDPRGGQVAWARRYPEPIQEPATETRRSEMGFTV